VGALAVVSQGQTQSLIDLARINTIAVWERGKLSYEMAGPSWSQWYPYDTYENYIKNGNKEFSIEDVSYQVNSHGYRCKEFSAIDHRAFKILTIGCSMTFGVGIPFQLTFGEQLAALIRHKYGIEVEVINMGAGASSIDYVTRVLFQSFPILQPHYVFCLLPDMNRREYFTSYGHIHVEKFGPWDSPTKCHEHALLALGTETWDFFSMVKNVAMIELILRDAHWSWDTWMVGENLTGFEAYFDMKHYRNQILDHPGKARDNCHHGVPYHTYVANDLMTDPDLLKAIDLYTNEDCHPSA
jgi:hypothetical protein